ncbi:MAG: DUF4091 domain-containing protein [Clostridiales bacterium]|jgi:hypothetical protein|nr:DUF4091 domain-containing protein [Clostridiales bacterium]
MRKKWLGTALAAMLAVSFAFAGGCAKTTPSADDLATVWAALATEKFMRDEEVKNRPACELNFAGMKNETQSLQIMLTAKQKITNFDLGVADLKSADGKVFSKDRISVYAERYVNVDKPMFTGGEWAAPAGYYPDALVPLDKYQIRREDKVEMREDGEVTGGEKSVATKGNNQGIWIDVHIPSDAVAGTYAGEFTLTLNKTRKKAIPVSLKVYDLAMPDEVHSKSAFDIWYGSIAGGEGENFDGETTYQTYYDYLLTKRLTCENVPPQYTSSLDVWIDYVAELAENPKVTTCAIPNQFFQREPGDLLSISGLKTTYKKILNKNIELREAGNTKIDILKKLFFYLDDEPWPGERTDNIKKNCARIHTAKTELLAEYSSQFLKYPDLADSLKGIFNMVPSSEMYPEMIVDSKSESAYEPDLDVSNGLTSWCPISFAYDNPVFRAKAYEHQARGDIMWWYTCVGNSPVPSLLAESIPINIRLQSWMQYDYNVEGVLYWQVCHWNELSDPYENLHYAGYGGGEGILLYPGVRYGMKTPLSSVRLENLRLGQQDYEYFWMLNEYLSAAGGGETARDVVSGIGKNLYSGTTVLDTEAIYSGEYKGHGVLEESRIKLLDILQEFAKGEQDKARQLISAM